MSISFESMNFEVILKAGRKVEEVCVSLQQEYKWVFGRSKCFWIKNKKFKKVAKHSSELSIDIMIEENTFKSTKRFKMKKKCFKLNAKFLFFVEKIMIYYLIFFLSLFRFLLIGFQRDGFFEKKIIHRKPSPHHLTFEIYFTIWVSEN